MQSEIYTLNQHSDIRVHSKYFHYCANEVQLSQGGAVIKPAEGGGVAEDSLSFSLSLSPRLALFFCLWLYFIKVKRQRLKRPRADSVFLSFSLSPSRSLYLSLSLFNSREKVTPDKAKSRRECFCPSFLAPDSLDIRTARMHARHETISRWSSAPQPPLDAAHVF